MSRRGGLRSQHGHGREIVDDRWTNDEKLEDYSETWRLLPGLFGTTDDAETEARTIVGFADASVQTK